MKRIGLFLAIVAFVGLGAGATFSILDELRQRLFIAVPHLAFMAQIPEVTTRWTVQGDESRLYVSETVNGLAHAAHGPFPNRQKADEAVERLKAKEKASARARGCATEELRHPEGAALVACDRSAYRSTITSSAR